MFKNAFKLLVVVLILAASVETIADPDLWGHLYFGKDILQLGMIPTIDSFSYLTTNCPWINHEWLSEVCMAFAYNLGGTSGLVILKSLLVLAISLLLLSAFITSGLGCLSFLMMIPTLVLLAPTIFVIRPNLFTTLFLTLQLILQNSYANNKKPIKLFLLPLLFAVWANFHGGFLLGLVILIIWSSASLLTTFIQRKYFTKEDLISPIIVILSIAATAFNPYHFQLLFFLLKTATIPRPEITEWMPIQIISILGLNYLLMVAVGLVSLILSHKKKDIPTLVIWFILALGPLLARRFVPFFAVENVLFIAPHLTNAIKQYSFKNMAQMKYFSILVAATLYSLITMLIFTVINDFGRIHSSLTDSDYPQKKLVTLLSGIKGNALVPFNWGEYFIWHFSPNLKVAVDGRRETIYPNEVYKAYLNFHNGTNRWDELIEKYPTDLVIVQLNTPTINLMNLKPGWTQVYADSVCAVFVKPNTKYSDQFKVLPPCLPALSEAYFP